MITSPHRIIRRLSCLTTSSPFRPSHLRKTSPLTVSYFTTSSKAPPFSVAIVGAGPSGFYTTKYLSSYFSKSRDGDSLRNVKIDMIEKLPTPYGLVRSGVAPDHPEVKNVENDFAALFDQGNGESGSVSSSLRYVGNVTLGKDVSLRELGGLYDAVVLCYGCGSDRKLGVEGEGLDGVFSAREFVAWYNGHPDYTYMDEKLLDILSNPEESKVVVIGQGNVALDCARILAKGGTGLYHTDLAAHALPVLKGGVKRVTVAGRRGHVQGAFTIKELRELTKLYREGHDTAFIVREEDLEMGTTDATREELKSQGSRPKIRIDSLLKDAAMKTLSSSEKLKEVRLRFLMNPTKMNPSKSDPTRVGSVVFEATKLEGEPFSQIAVGTDRLEELDADMVLVSIGYKGVPLDEDIFDDMFDEARGVVKNVNGKVVLLKDFDLYVSGWLKRGPSGIIGTNIADAKDTVASIIQDFEMKEKELEGSSDRKGGRDGLLNLLEDRGVTVIDWTGFTKIDEAERENQRSDLQPREKFTSIQEMVDAST